MIITALFTASFTMSHLYAGRKVDRNPPTNPWSIQNKMKTPEAKAAGTCSIRRSPIPPGFSIYKVMSIDEEGRQTEAEFATSEASTLQRIKRRFAATGKLKCRSGELDAQLTGASDVITTNAHALFKPENCEELSKPNECTFSTEVNGKPVIRRVSAEVGMGFNCPGGGEQESNTDWAVMTLESKIDDVEPYALPRADYLLDPGVSVISVTVGSSDLIEAKWKSSKAIDKCVTQTVHSTYPAYFKTNCDTSSGVSGGSILEKIKDRDVLIGINQGNTETDTQRKRGAEGNRHQCDYHEETCFSGHVKLEGNFLEAVKSAVKKSPESV